MVVYVGHTKEHGLVVFEIRSKSKEKHLLFASACGPPTIYVHAPDIHSWAWVDVLKSPTSDNIWDNIWLDHMFKSGGNPHFTNRFCKIELAWTTRPKSHELFVEVMGFLLKKRNNMNNAQTGRGEASKHTGKSFVANGFPGKRPM